MEEENSCATDHSDVTEAEKWRKSKSFVATCKGNPGVCTLPVSIPCGKPLSLTLQTLLQ